MMLRYSLNVLEAGELIENTVNRVLDKNLRSPDIFSPGTQKVGIREMGEAVLVELKSM